jgi:hypothetical protein
MPDPRRDSKASRVVLSCTLLRSAIRAAAVIVETRVVNAISYFLSLQTGRRSVSTEGHLFASNGATPSSRKGLSEVGPRLFSPYSHAFRLFYSFAAITSMDVTCALAVCWQLLYCQLSADLPCTFLGVI